MRRILLSILTCIGTLAGGVATAECDSGELVIRMSTVTNYDRHPTGLAASMLSDRVNEEMNGLACMEVYGNSILYTDDKVIEALLKGDIQLAAPSLGKVEEYTKLLRVFSLPFIFKNVDAVDEFQNSLTGGLMKFSMVGKGVRGLAFWHVGMTQMSASVPLNSPLDALGLDFRVLGSEIGLEQMKAVGASGTQMAFSEVFSALEDGEIDGQEDTWSNIYGKRFHRVQDTIIETNHSIVDNFVITSVEWFDSLPGNIKTQFLTILREVTEERNKAAYAVNQAARQLILDDGGRVRKLTPEERQEWVDAFRPVWDKFRDDVHPFLIEHIQEVNARH
jgi:C4-dicarboxylate-binding protein DctP